MKLEKKSTAEIVDKIPSYINNHRNIDEIAKKIEQEKETEILKNKWKKIELKPIQQKIYNKMKNQTERQITFVIDKKGGKGKSTLAKYIFATHDCYLTTSTAYHDNAYNYDRQKYIIFDIARQQENLIQYNLLEDMKNGILFCKKYESTTKIFDSPKILFLCNFDVDMSKLTEDRYDIINI